MSFSPADSTIFSPLFSVPEIAEIFSDERYLSYLLHVEGALALCQEQLGIVPEGVGQQIAQAASTLEIDLEELKVGTEKAGLPIINLVRQLRDAVSSDAASYVHWGATTQDIMDTGLILQLRDGLDHLEYLMTSLIHKLAQLAVQHRHTLMSGRTHSQQALPITFGFKVANWLTPLVRHHQRLAELRSRLLVVQFGGAAGTLASLDEFGIEVVEGLAAELRLDVPLSPWHTQRDNVVELGSWLSLVSASLAKMAQDIILLAQSEIGELRESADLSRGGSSTMPQKSNPVISEVIIAAARTSASLLSSLHQAMIQEHERATHGWQMEWLALPQIFGLTACALEKALYLSKNLVVNTEQMRENVAASNGLMLAEAVSFALCAQMPRVEAKRLVNAGVQIVLAEGRHLVDVVEGMTDVSVDWAALRNESNYCGASQYYIDQILTDAALQIEPQSINQP